MILDSIADSSLCSDHFPFKAASIISRQMLLGVHPVAAASNIAFVGSRIARMAARACARLIIARGHRLGRVRTRPFHAPHCVEHLSATPHGNRPAADRAAFRLRARSLSSSSFSVRSRGISTLRFATPRIGLTAICSRSIAKAKIARRVSRQRFTCCRKPSLRSRVSRNSTTSARVISPIGFWPGLGMMWQRIRLSMSRHDRRRFTLSIYALAISCSGCAFASAAYRAFASRSSAAIRSIPRLAAAIISPALSRAFASESAG